MFVLLVLCQWFYPGSAGSANGNLLSVLVRSARFACWFLSNRCSQCALKAGWSLVLRTKRREGVSGWANLFDLMRFFRCKLRPWRTADVDTFYTCFMCFIFSCFCRQIHIYGLGKEYKMHYLKYHQVWIWTRCTGKRVDMGWYGLIQLVMLLTKVSGSFVFMIPHDASWKPNGEEASTFGYVWISLDMFGYYIYMRRIISFLQPMTGFLWVFSSRCRLITERWSVFWVFASQGACGGRGGESPGERHENLETFVLFLTKNKIWSISSYRL